MSSKDISAEDKITPYIRRRIASECDLDEIGLRMATKTIRARLRKRRDFNEYFKIRKISEFQFDYQVKKGRDRRKRLNKIIDDNLDGSTYDSRNPTREEAFLNVLKKTIRIEYGLKSQARQMNMEVERFIQKHKDKDIVRKYSGSKKKATLQDQVYLRLRLGEIIFSDTIRLNRNLRTIGEKRDIEDEEIIGPKDEEIWKIESE